MAKSGQSYRPTESERKGGAQEMYVTYDLPQRTRGGGRRLHPKVKRVYVAGKVRNWQVGTFKKRTGRSVHGVRIDYERGRAGYVRKGYTATRGEIRYKVPETKVPGSRVRVSKIVEVPEGARNVRFRSGSLPQEYRSALHNVR